MLTLEDLILILMCLQLGDYLKIAVGLLLIGLSFVSCFSLTYLIIKIVNKKYHIQQSITREAVEIDNIPEKVEIKVPKEGRKLRKIEPSVNDDLPFSAPMKVETNFGSGELGKTKE